jgi:uncharacterized protein YaaW (UPF0174 family)
MRKSVMAMKAGSGAATSERVMDNRKLIPKGRSPEIEKAGDAALDLPLPAKDRLTDRLASGLAERLVLKGTGPLPLIADDPLVELLGKATNEELAPLVEILCTKGGVMCQLARTASYRNNNPNHQAYVRDIAAEIQKFGANTLKTQLLRSGKGVPYEQIVRDVAGRVGVKSAEKSTREIEREIVTKLLMETYETMAPEQRRELLLSLKIRDRKLLLAPGGVEAARLAIQHSGFAVYKGSVIVANAAAQQLLGHGLSVAANAALAKGIAVFAGPVGLVFAALLGGNAAAAPARRVTVPIVLQVAAIRAVHEYHHETAWEQFIKLMRRHKWKIGIVVALVAWLLFHFHVFR